MATTKTPKLTILYEDDTLVAINKPSGLVVHSDGKTVEPNVCDWLIEKYGMEIREVGEPAKAPTGEILYRPGIVHRLDRGTSGVMVIAKTQECYEFLKKQFQEREVSKIYNAFVWGHFAKEDEKGVINRPIGKSKSDFRKWSAERFARGELRPAVTEYKVLLQKDDVKSPHADIVDVEGEKGDMKEDATTYKMPMNFAYVEARPKTGRTHQIRVHFKAINHPIVGDRLYAANHPTTLGFERIALHARQIEIEDMSGKKLTIEAPLPPDFEKALKYLK